MLNIETTKETQLSEQKLRYSKMNWEKGIKRGADNAGQSVVRRARTLLNTGIRTGRKYKSLPNRSSAPGEMPRSQSGRLAQLMESRTGGIHSFSVLNSAAYARVLGTGDPERNLRPRKSRDNPWLKSVIDLEEGITEKYLQDGPYQEIK